MNLLGTVREVDVRGRTRRDQANGAAPPPGDWSGGPRPRGLIDRYSFQIATPCSGRPCPGSKCSTGSDGERISRGTLQYRVLRAFRKAGLDGQCARGALQARCEYGPIFRAGCSYYYKSQANVDISTLWQDLQTVLVIQVAGFPTDINGGASNAAVPGSRTTCSGSDS